MSHDVKKPTPRPGLIWRYCHEDRIVVRTIARVDPAHVHTPSVWWLGEAGGAYVKALMSSPAWSCIGVETARSVIMVGEQRLARDLGVCDGLVTVIGLRDDGDVVLRSHVDGTTIAYPAERVASWPLVPFIDRPVAAPHVEAVAVHTYYASGADETDYYVFLRMSDGTYRHIDEGNMRVEAADPSEKLAGRVGHEKTLRDLDWLPVAGGPSTAPSSRPALAVLVADFEQELLRAEAGMSHAKRSGHAHHEAAAKAEARTWKQALAKLRNVLAGLHPDTPPKPITIEFVDAAIQAIISAPTSAMQDRAESWCREHGVDPSKAADLAEVFQCWAAEYHRRGAHDEAVATALRARAATAEPTPDEPDDVVIVELQRLRKLLRQGPRPEDTPHEIAERLFPGIVARSPIHPVMDDARAAAARRGAEEMDAAWRGVVAGLRQAVLAVDAQNALEVARRRFDDLIDSVRHNPKQIAGKAKALDALLLDRAAVLALFDP